MFISSKAYPASGVSSLHDNWRCPAFVRNYGAAGERRDAEANGQLLVFESSASAPPALRVTAERGVKSFEASLGPELAGVVVIPERRRSLRQLEPLRFRARVDVHVRLHGAGLVERSDAYEPEIGPAPIVAPDRGLTPWAAVDIVSTIFARHRYGYRFAVEKLDRLSLDNRVEYEGAARQPLAVVAMTAVDEHWLVEELVADRSAGAAAGDFLCHRQR